MRIGVFELDFVFQPLFVLAEVYSRKAKLLRSIHIRNVRGTEKNWLKLYAEINGKRTLQRVVRDLGVNDEETAKRIEAHILDGLILPSGLYTGQYTARLVINDENGEHEVPFNFQVLPRQVIPTDFVRAPFLSAYISMDDTLRNFSSKALDGRIDATPAQTLQFLYEALLQQQLNYQPVSLTSFPDCQEISKMTYALNSGGSCSDLSLLMASLLWCRGVSPALLLFPDHMAAGCFSDEVPSFETLAGSDQILSLIGTGMLTVVESTALCRYLQADYQEAIQRIEIKLRSGKPCMLINVRQTLASGTAVCLPETFFQYIRCPACGYDRFKNLSPDTRKLQCPACGELFSAAPENEENLVQPTDSFIAYSAKLQYGLAKGSVFVMKMQSTEEKTVRVAPVWQGRTVRSIASRAFAGTGVVRVILPDSITSIEDYAFQNCKALNQLALPPDISEIGTGAFAESGLTVFRIPGTIQRIPRLAFYGCSDLEKVELEEGIEKIDEMAFVGCRSLRSITIPASVKQIARNAFDRDCELLMCTNSTIFI